MRRVLAVAIALNLVLALGACRGRESAGRGELRLEEGKVEVAHQGGDWEEIKGSAVRRGDRARVPAGGRAVLSLSDGATLELREGTVLQVGPSVVLEIGDLLVMPASEPVTIETGGVAAVVSGGAARLARTLAFEAASYAGRIDIVSAGRTLTVPALRQASVVAPGLLPDAPSALALRSPEDSWDRRFLGEWIDFGRDLEARSRGLTGQLPRGANADANFYRLLLPPLEREPELPRLIDPSRPRGETVVGSSIVLEGDDGDFAERWAEVFGFRDAGASWGLVALDQQVKPGPVADEIQLALGRFVDVGRSSALPPRRRPAPKVPPTTLPPVTAPPTTGVRSVVPPTTAPPPPPAEPILDTGIAPIDDAQAPLVETLSGLLQGLVNLLGLGAKSSG